MHLHAHGHIEVSKATDSWEIDPAITRMARLKRADKAFLYECFCVCMCLHVYRRVCVCVCARAYVQVGKTMVSTRCLPRLLFYLVTGSGFPSSSTSITQVWEFICVPLYLVCI